MRRSLFFLAGIVLVSTGRPMTSTASVLLSGHATAARLKKTQTVGPASPTDRMHLSLVVKLDPDRLTQTAAPFLKHRWKDPLLYMSPEEFSQRLDIASKRETLKEFARSHGLTLEGRDRSNSMVVHVSGSVSAVERAFGVSVGLYSDKNGRVFKAPDVDPSVPDALAPHLQAVLGLSTQTQLRHPNIRMSRIARGSNIFTGSGPAHALSPSDIQTVYGLSSLPLKGSGQSLALIEFDGYNPNDISSYETRFGLPSTSVVPVSVDGTPNLCGINQDSACDATTLRTDSGMVEVALDIEMAVALAPQLTQVSVYASSNTDQGGIDVFDRIATDNSASQVSTSWGLAEDETAPAVLTAENQILQRMAVQGQSVFAASGDEGAYSDGQTLSADDPAAQPYITGVGGTSLSGTPQSHTEITWDGGSISNGASGGGVSQAWPIPAYQLNTPGVYSSVKRNFPDVALNADPQSAPYYIYVASTGYELGGTSAAAPLWAAFAALINQERAMSGLAPWGFANSTIYELAKSNLYHSIFTDITTGNNLFYTAGVGYDNATGWGSFIGQAFLLSAIDVPILSSETPQTASQGTSGITLTVNGQNFVSGSSVTWNGSGRPTTLVNSTQLQATLTTTDLGTVGSNSVSVINPGGQASINSLTFTVGYPDDITSASNVYVYPNPWDVRKDTERKITFANLYPGTSVKIFTISGFLVKAVTASSDQQAIWDLSNDSGQTVASGLYLYQATSNGHSVKGKIVLIR